MRKRKSWSPEEVIKEIIRLNKKGEPLNAYNIMKKHSKLYGAARKYFENWGNAVTIAGFDYEKINRRVDEVSWSREKVIECIKERYRKGLSLRSDYVQKQDTKLHSAAQRYFQSWKNACEAAGFDYEKDIKQIKWTKEVIINKIKELDGKGEDLSSSSVQKNYMDLFQAGCRLFGSWKNAIEGAGLNYSKFRKQKSWTREIIFAEIDRIKETVGEIKAGYISQNHGALYQAARRVFGSWTNTMREYKKRENNK